jgi:hypothetical protein
MKISGLFFSVLILCLNLLNACSEKPKQMKNLDEIRPKSEGKERIKETKESKDTLLPYLTSYTQDSVLLEIESISPIEHSHFINRFQPVKKTAFLLQQKDSTENIEHFAWEFKDSVATKNAFYNWLDIEKSSKILSSKSLSKLFFTTLITEKHIDFFYSNKKMDVPKLMRYVKFNRNTETYKYIIIQKRNSKALWYQFADEKLTLIPSK